MGNDCQILCYRKGYSKTRAILVLVFIVIFSVKKLPKMGVLCKNSQIWINPNWGCRGSLLFLECIKQFLHFYIYICILSHKTYLYIIVCKRTIVLCLSPLSDSFFVLYIYIITRIIQTLCKGESKTNQVMLKLVRQSTDSAKQIGMHIAPLAGVKTDYGTNILSFTYWNKPG